MIAPLVARLADRSARRYDLGRAPQEALALTTPDGVTLPLARLSGGRSRGPVVLCHGLGGNARSFDLPGTLGTYLAARGFDVFVPELRATRRASGREAPPRLVDLGRDVAAIAARVAAIAGGPPAWVGHSLGGSMALTQPSSLFTSIVAVGPNLAFEGNTALADVLALGGRLARALGRDAAPQALLGALEAPIMGRFEWPRALAWVSPAGIDGALLRALHAVGLEDVPRSLMDELSAWIAGAPGADVAALRAAAAGFAGRVLVLSGTDDAWAPPAAVRATLAHLARAEVERVEVEANHASLLFGRDREPAVFAPIARFLGG